MSKFFKFFSLKILTGLLIAIGLIGGVYLASAITGPTTGPGDLGVPATDTGLLKTFINNLIGPSGSLTLGLDEVKTDTGGILTKVNSLGASDATAANQNTILSKLGNSTDAASLSGSLFAAQKAIYDKIPASYTTCYPICVGSNSYPTCNSGYTKLADWGSGSGCASPAQLGITGAISYKFEWVGTPSTAWPYYEQASVWVASAPAVISQATCQIYGFDGEYYYTQDKSSSCSVCCK